ncbi:NAD(P)H-binding protein [Solirubrobacter sp. CPCC 204708]|uniref:NAD(P)H-binding protein n=1 Tax=Solirubrobacter deserti TaxID=2282478 RepID=A0ABT4RS33_9ACTN|nr:NAD(P)H-binding protein [Solirubrobacter deserti]MBE2319868.1 NAD(P)H-binding protein [Solirubrobacter deserti]MDA0141401.1 NAD(P)H-binding protein [Solirubrobacter deserti]
MIAVTTPTGNVGRHVTAMLIRAGVRPRVLVRDPAKLDHPDHVDAVQVDLTDRDAVAAAMEGVDALYWVTPASFMSPDPLADYAAYAEVAAHAIERNGIARTVFQSSVGAELRGGAGEIDGLAATEQRLERVAPAITHLRCGFFFVNLLHQREDIERGALPIILPTDFKMPWVDPRDIAEVATGRLLNRDWTGRHVQAVHGPEDLSWDDVAHLLSEATGTPVKAERVPDEAMRAGLQQAGMNERQISALMGMSTGLREGFTPEQPRDATTTTPTTLRAFIADHISPRQPA